jgi:hypothetical protein
VIKLHVAGGTALGDGTASAELATWMVSPVARAEAWMPRAHFDHARHGTSLTPCSTCHDAEHSKKETDILMPRIDTCRTCHGGERGHPGNANLIASTCTMCHSFHQAPNPLWANEVSSAANGTH